MPRYLIERSFADGLALPVTAQGAALCAAIAAKNAARGATWIRSYVSADKRKSFCIYDAPSPEAIRSCAAANMLPVDRITEVRVLDPHFHH